MDLIFYIKILQYVLHYGLHFVAPSLIAWMFYRKEWKRVAIIMTGTILVDLDHLFSNPIFDPNRCSIGHHLLHSEYAILFYFVLLCIPKTRIVGIGLVLHMFADALDCGWMYIFN